jgi:cytochrome b
MMGHAQEGDAGGGAPPAAAMIAVWDLPTRLFHWLLAVLVAVSLATGWTGGNAMTWHARSGYAILALLLFRLAWGVMGSPTARFGDFIRGPAVVWRYAVGLWRSQAPRTLGHNPMGGWSVLAMLAALLFQAASGLFADDQILTAGPLAARIPAAAGAWLTRLHRFNQWTIVGLVATHLGAIGFYLLVKGENLIVPMLSGRKRWPAVGGPVMVPARRAVLPLGLAVLAVWLLVR